MKRMYRTGVATLIAFILMSFLISCLDDDTVDPGPISFVSIYHASPDAPDLDIIVDDQKLNTIPFTYGYGTDYLRFSSGTRNLQFGPFGGSVVSIDTLLTLEPDKNFSIFVVDEFERARVMMLFDDPSPPAAGKGKLRFINLSPDSNPVQLKIKGVPLAITVGQSFMDASSFMDLEGKIYDFEVHSGGEIVAELPNTEIQSGFFHTILVRGFVNPPTGNTKVLDTHFFVN